MGSHDVNSVALVSSSTEAYVFVNCLVYTELYTFQISDFVLCL